MADNVFSTDSRSMDTRPEVPRLLAEGTATISVADFSAVTGGYEGQASVDITDVNDIGNTNKSGPGVGNRSFKVEIMHGFASTSEFYSYRFGPYTIYSGGAVNNVLYTEIVNQKVFISDFFSSSLRINYFTKDNNNAVFDSAFYAQTFKYKIWSSIF